MTDEKPRPPESALSSYLRHAADLPAMHGLQDGPVSVRELLVAAADQIDTLITNHQRDLPPVFIVAPAGSSPDEVCRRFLARTAGADIEEPRPDEEEPMADPASGPRCQLCGSTVEIKNNPESPGLTSWLATCHGQTVALVGDDRAKVVPQLLLALRRMPSSNYLPTRLTEAADFVEEHVADLLLAAASEVRYLELELSEVRGEFRRARENADGNAEGWRAKETP